MFWAGSFNCCWLRWLVLVRVLQGDRGGLVMAGVVLPGLPHACQDCFHDVSGMHRRGNFGIVAGGRTNGREHVTRFRIALFAIALNDLQEIGPGSRASGG